MMLVHKHPMMPLSPSLVHAHRRNPSAPPTVIVQPTRTPGLLSLSKPPRPSPTHNRQLHAQQRHQKAASRPRLPTSVVVDRSTPVFPLSAAPSPLPSPQQQRGRAHAKQSKDKPDASSKSLLRSTSNNSLRGSRSARQPSPPTLPPAQTSQVEGPSVSQAASLFDPFVDDASQHKTTLTLNSKPSGKLARRRQPQAGAVPPSAPPASSKAIPLPPVTTRAHVHNLSRSDPAQSHMPTEQQRRRSSTATGAIAFDVFPICDDMTDAGDVSDHEPPVTPTRPKAQNKFTTSPRTAPATGFFPLLPSAPSSAPQHKSRQGGRKHKRSPSEGVFNMSSDEDTSMGWNPSVGTLFQLARTPGAGKRVSLQAYSSPFKTVAPVTPRSAKDLAPAAAQAKERQFEKEAAEKVAGYFASSSFQNSPSPDELPDPLFL